MLLSIVIPLYNEEENIRKLLDSLFEVMNELEQDFEIIAVDDGSTDSTLLKLKKEKETKKLNKLRIIELRKNFGQTAALLAGFSKITGDIVISMDGDLQNDPKDIPELLKKLNEGYDVVCGWRKERKDSIFKKIPSKISNYLNKRWNKIDIHDSGCTLRAYVSEAAKDLKITAEGHRYIPAILSHLGYKITEIPVTHHPRHAGKTKYGSGRLFRGSMDLFSLQLFYSYRARPILLFAKVGLLMFLGGFLSTILLIYERLYLGGSLSDRPAFYLSVLFTVVAFQIILTGFIAELYVRSSSQPSDSYRIRKEY